MKRAFVVWALLSWGCGTGTMEPDGGATQDGAHAEDAPMTSMRCGDGVVDPGEACDDGNDASYDGCEPVTCEPTCQSDGDCDDHLTCNGTETCQPCADETCAAGRSCAAGTALPDATSCTMGSEAGVCHAGVCVMAGCGNGVVEVGEHCDDGNGTGRDGCESDCRYTCEVVDPSMPNTWYLDCDSDGYALPTAHSETQCLPPATGACGGGWTLRAPVGGAADCNDDRRDINPGAAEVCDGYDTDCNGTIDDGVMTTFYADADHDGHGNPDVSLTGCTAPSGYVTSNDDCSDSCPTCFPGNTELCDGQDNDCSGAGDTMTTYYADDDHDGYGDAAMTTTWCSAPPGYVSDATDCDDSQAAVHPGATEVCDGADSNCNGLGDEPYNRYWRDGDNDGHGDATMPMDACSRPASYATNSDDCCDTDYYAHPGQSDWFDRQRYGCGGYDFSCDGVETHLVTGIRYVGTCLSHGTSASCNADTGSGWARTLSGTGGDPGCGGSANWVLRCDWDSSSGLCGEIVYPVLQECH